MKIEKNKIWRDDKSFSDRYSEVDSKITTLEKECSKLSNKRNTISPGGFGITFGPFVIISSLMFSGFIYMTSKKRELIAFHTQQVMPVAQEGIEKMTPTVSKTARTMAEEITKGVASVKNDKDKNE